MNEKQLTLDQLFRNSKKKRSDSGLANDKIPHELQPKDKLLKKNEDIQEKDKNEKIIISEIEWKKSNVEDYNDNEKLVVTKEQNIDNEASNLQDLY